AEGRIVLAAFIGLFHRRKILPNSVSFSWTTSEYQFAENVRDRKGHFKKYKKILYPETFDE
ncbi:MAG: hypothetical protein ACRYFX_16155, partial [Janthinobacterium lividum]